VPWPDKEGRQAARASRVAVGVQDRLEHHAVAPRVGERVPTGAGPLHPCGLHADAESGGEGMA
jgi:hypothetical protein